MTEFSRQSTGPQDISRGAGELAARTYLDTRSPGMDVQRPVLAETPTDAQAVVSPADVLGPPPANRVPGDDARNYPPRPADSRPTPQGDTPTVATGPTDHGGPPPPDKPGRGEQAHDPRDPLQIFEYRANQPPPTKAEADAANRALTTTAAVWNNVLGLVARTGEPLTYRTSRGQAVAYAAAGHNLATAAETAAHLRSAAAGCEILAEYVEQTGDRAVVVQQTPVVPAGPSMAVGQLEVRNTGDRIGWSNRALERSSPLDETRNATFEPYPVTKDTAQFVNQDATERCLVQTRGTEELIVTIDHAYTIPEGASGLLYDLRREMTEYADLLQANVTPDPAADRSKIHLQAAASVTRIAALLQADTRARGTIPDTAVDFDTLHGYLVRFTGAIENTYRENTADAPGLLPENHRQFRELAARGNPTWAEYEAAAQVAPLMPSLVGFAQQLKEAGFGGNGSQAEIDMAVQRTVDSLLNNSEALSITSNMRTACQALASYTQIMTGRNMVIDDVRRYGPGTGAQIGQFTFHVLRSGGLALDQTPDLSATLYSRYTTPGGEIQFVGRASTHRVCLLQVGGGVVVTEQNIHRLVDGTAEFLDGLALSLKDVMTHVMELKMGGDNQAEHRAQLSTAARRFSDTLASAEGRWMLSALQDYVEAVANNPKG